MKKLLLTLFITLLALPVYCSTAEELQDALDDMSIDYCTTYFPKGVATNEWNLFPLEAAHFEPIYPGKLKVGYVVNRGKFELFETYTLSSLPDSFTAVEDDWNEPKPLVCTIVSFGKFKSAINNDYVKEFIKKMRNIIRLSKKL